MSAANGSTAGFPDAARISAATCPVRATSRPVMPIRAPRRARPIAVALPIPPVPPVISTILPTMRFVSDTDDNRSSRMSFSDMSERLAGITQRVSGVDDRCDLAGFDELFQDEQVRSVGKFDGRTQLPAVEHRHCGRLEDGTDGAEPTTARSSVVGLQLSAGGENAPGV